MKFDIWSIIFANSIDINILLEFFITSDRQDIHKRTRILDMRAESASSKYILAYDADCGPCTKFSHIVDAIDRQGKIDFISLVNADQKGLLDSIPPNLRYKSFHLIFFPGGVAKSGAEGFLELIAILPAGKIISSIINYFPGGKRIVRFIYGRFSKLHSVRSCSLNNGSSDIISNKKKDDDDDKPDTV